MDSLSDKNKIWQLDEVLLILFASGRFHNLDDITLLSETFERIFPKTALIGFKGNRTFISRQIDSIKKKKYVIPIGENVSISATGRNYALQLFHTKIMDAHETHNQSQIESWKLFKKILTRLPRVRAMWTKYLEDYFSRLNR